MRDDRLANSWLGVDGESLSSVGGNAGSQLGKWDAVVAEGKLEWGQAKIIDKFSQDGIAGSWREASGSNMRERSIMGNWNGKLEWGQAKIIDKFSQDGIAGSWREASGSNMRERSIM